MNLNQLRAFYMVIKTGSFSGAAEELCVTEPAVFIQVRSLERHLGFTLLDKFGKELRPTEAGRVLYDYGEKIFTLVEEATKAVQELQDLKKGFLRLGVTQPLAQYLMPVLISAFQDKYPRIAVSMDGSSSRELVEGILQHRYELAVVARVPYPEKITYIPYTRDDILLVVSPHHHLATRDTVSLSELAKEPVILTDAKSAVKFSVWKEFEEKGLHPSAIIEAGNIEFIKQVLARPGVRIHGHAFMPLPGTFFEHEEPGKMTPAILKVIGQYTKIGRVFGQHFVQEKRAVRISKNSEQPGPSH